MGGNHTQGYTRVRIPSGLEAYFHSRSYLFGEEFHAEGSSSQNVTEKRGGRRERWTKRRFFFNLFFWFDPQPDFCLNRSVGVEMWENGVKRRWVDSPSGEHRGNHPHKWWIEGEIILEAAGKSSDDAWKSEMGNWAAPPAPDLLCRRSLAGCNPFLPSP